MAEGLVRRRESDGTITWSIPRKAEASFTIRLFALPHEKIFRCGAPEEASAVAECLGGEDQEVEVEPGKYNVVGGDRYVNYLHVIEIGDDGSVKETTGLWSDALRDNMFGGNLAQRLNAPNN